MDIKIIRDILKTYDLPKPLERRLVGIATRRLQEIGFTGFDAQYQYIDGLVEKFTADWNERRNISLDAPVIWDSKDSIHSLIPANIESPEQALLNDDYLNNLKGKLSEEEFRIVLSLLGITNVESFLKEYSSSPIPTLKARIEKIFGVNSKEARLISIGVPLRYIDLDTGEMRFGQRRFGGNPLAHFNSHPERYEGKLRSQLKVLDPGLLSALYKSGQIDLAIPNAYRRFHGNPLAYVQSHPEEFADVRIRRQLELKDPSVYRNLLKHKQIGLVILEISPHVRPLSTTQIEEIAAAFKPSKGVAREAARHVPYSETTILKYWKFKELIKKNRSYSDDKLPEEEVERVKASFYSSNGVASRAAREVGHAVQTVNRIWRNHGLKNNQNSHPYNSHTQDEIDKIVALHEHYGGFVYDAARDTKRKPKTFEKYWGQAGLPIFKGKPPLIRGNELTSPFRLERIVNSVTIGDLSPEEARNVLRHKSVLQKGNVISFFGYEIAKGPNNELLGIELLYNGFDSWPHEVQKAA